MTIEETNVPRCKYYIDEEKRKVVCVILNTKNAVFEYIYKNNFDDYFPIWNIMNKLEMPNTFSGVATCKEDETFDVQIGKKIAYNKAKMKFDNSLFKRFQKYIDYIDNHFNEIILRIDGYGEKLADKQEARRQQIDEYFNK